MTDGAVGVRVAGVAVPAATVTLRVYEGGLLIREHLAPGSTPDLDIDIGAPLSAGQQVAALQAIGLDISPEGPRVVVESAADPFASGPTLQVSEVDIESRGVRVLGAIPGWVVEVVEPRGGQVVGTGVAGPDGNADVLVDLSKLAVFSDSVAARHGGVVYPFGASCLVVLDNDMLEVPRSLWMPPCTRVVQLVDTSPGTTVRVRLLTRSGEATAIAFGTTLDVWMPDELSDEDAYVVQSSWDLVWGVPGFYRDSAYAKYSPTETRAPLSAPRLLGVYEGASTVLALDQFPGATVVLTVTDATGFEVASWQRGGTLDPEFPLGAPLAHGDVVTVSQVLCSDADPSESATVTATLAPVVVTPVVIGPLFAGGGAVTVAGTVAGALVEVLSNGIVIGAAWAFGNAAALAVSPFLLLSAEITARMTLVGTLGPLSAPVTVGAGPDVLVAPRLLEPIVVGDDVACVTGVTPGARVQVLDGANVVRGEVFASESLVRVPVAPAVLNRQLRPRVILGAMQVDGLEVPTANPIEERILDHVLEATFRLDVGTLVNLDPGIIAGPVRGHGQVYLPTLPDSSVRPPIGLALIVHGCGDGPHILYPTVTDDTNTSRPDDGFGNRLGTVFEPPEGDPNTSYLGYGWLATQLAAKGLHVFSIRVDQFATVPDLVAIANAYLDRLREDATSVEYAKNPADVVTLTPYSTYYLTVPVLLIGHSNGGEAAYIMAESGERNVVGVLAITPSRNEGPRVASVPILQVNGSDDHFYGLVGRDDTAHFLDDTSIRPRALLWLPGAAHDDFNAEWYYEGWIGYTSDSPIFNAAFPERGRVTMEETQALTLPIALAFLLARLGDNTWVGWLDGTVQPPAHRTGDARLRYWPARGPVDGPEGTPLVVDDFSGENADSTINALGLPVSWSLPDLSVIGLPYPKLRWDADLPGPAEGGLVGDDSDGIHAPDGRVVHLMWAKDQVAVASYTTTVDGAWPLHFFSPCQLRVSLCLLHSGKDGLPSAFEVDGVDIQVNSATYNDLERTKDAYIVLTDRNGQQARVRFGAIRAIPYPGSTETAVAAQGVDAGRDPEPGNPFGYRMALQDWCLPLDAFQAVNHALDINAIVSVSIEPLAESAWIEVGLIEVDR